MKNARHNGLSSWLSSRSIILILIGLSLAYQAAVFYIVSFASPGNLATVTSLDQESPKVVTAVMNAKLANPEALRLNSSEQSNLNSALLREPLNRVLLRSLAISAELAGDRDRAADIMALASKVSRRDVITQMWLAEYYSRRALLTKAISHYDAALRVSPETRHVIFPRIWSLRSRQHYLNAMKGTVRGGELWHQRFLQYSVERAGLTDLGQVGELIYAGFGGHKHGPQLQSIVDEYVKRAVVMESGDSARKLLAELPEHNTSRFRNLIGWSGRGSPSESLFDWQFGEVDGLAAVVDRQDELSITAQPGVMGILARRSVLSPGFASRYRVVVSFFTDNNSANSDLEGRAVCGLGSNPRNIQAKKVINSTANRIQLQVDVPSDCQIVELQVIFENPDPQFPIDFRLSKPNIKISKSGDVS